MDILQSALNREWTSIDFKLNSIIWKNIGFEKSIDIRERNLIEIVELLGNKNVNVWLQGKTLLNAFEYGKLDESDHDEDLGVFKESWDHVKESINEELVGRGFYKIRDNLDIVSYMREGRYVDICLFKKSGTSVGYEEKFFPAKYFSSFTSIIFLNSKFLIPTNSKELLKVMYSDGVAKKRKKTKWRKVFSPDVYKKKSMGILDKVINNVNYRFLPVVNLLPFAGLKYEEISEEDFLNLLVEPIDSPNWYWRKPHLDIVTNNGTNVYVKDIISYFKNEVSLENTIAQIKETDTSSSFQIPNNLDFRFWQTGNNYFFYCIFYQFRKGVIPYHSANDYILKGIKPLLYSREYFESLVFMSDDEIQAFLLKHHIEITNNGCTSGKHRLFAMIGRLITGKSYIPFRAIIK